MRRILIAALLASGLILPATHAQDDVCAADTIMTSFAEATDMVVWSQQYSTCPSQIQRAVRTLASGYQLLTTDFLPFAAADNPIEFGPFWKWYPVGPGSANIDPVANTVYLIADRLSEQRDDITAAPVLAYPVNGNVTAQVKISFTPLDDKNGAGLGIRAAQDRNTWIRIARVGNNIEVVADTQGTSTIVDSQPYEGNTPDLYFKVERIGAQFTLSYSVNGRDWKQVTSDSNEVFPQDTEVFLTTFWPVESGAAQAQFSEMSVSE